MIERLTLLGLRQGVAAELLRDRCWLDLRPSDHLLSQVFLNRHRNGGLGV